MIQHFLSHSSYFLNGLKKLELYFIKGLLLLKGFALYSKWKQFKAFTASDAYYVEEKVSLSIYQQIS